MRVEKILIREQIKILNLRVKLNWKKALIKQKTNQKNKS